MIKTTKTDFKQKQVFHDTMDVSGKATFGSDVEIDGKLKVNSASDIVDSNDTPIINSISTDTWNLLMANMGVGRWANQLLHYWDWFENRIFRDDLAPYYTNLTRYLSGSKWVENKSSVPMYFAQDFNTTTPVAVDYMLSDITNLDTIYLPNMLIRGGPMIYSSSIKHLLIADGKNVKVKGSRIFLFRSSNIVEIGPFDMSEYEVAPYAIFDGCSNIKQIHCTHFRRSFIISYSTAFEESDLVEIISNLDEVTSTQTLTMGATNLAKLTDAEKKVATDKGWTLA